MKHLKLFNQFITERLGEKKIVISKSDMEKLHKDGKITIDDNEIEFVTEGKMSKEKIEDMIWSLENEVKSWHPSSDSKKKAMLDKLRKDLSKFESVVTEAKSKFKIGDRVSILSKSSKKPFDSGEVTGIQKDGTILINGLETISHEVAIDAELVVKESVVTEAKLKISGPAYDFWNDRDVQRKLKDVKVKIVGDIGGVMTISGADNEIQKVKDIFGLNESAVTEGKYANKTMNEMLTDTYHKALEEAKAYEADDNKDHTLEEYLTEMASLTAEKMYEMYESSCNEMREGMTKEMYESSCNKMKEAYNSKMDEMLKEYKK